MSPGTIRVAAAGALALLSAACTPDRMTSPGPSPAAIPPEVRRVLNALGPRDEPVAVLHAGAGKSGAAAPRLSAAAATLAGPDGSDGAARTIDPGGLRPSFDMDEGWLAFVVEPSGGRGNVAPDSTESGVFSFYCFDSRSGQWNTLLNVNVNSITQRAIPGTGGHLERHSLADKPVGAWSPRNGRTRADGTFPSVYTSGIAAGDEQIRVNHTILDDGSPCEGVTSVVTFDAAVRYRGLVEITGRDGLLFDAITSDHSSVFYATPSAVAAVHATHRAYRRASKNSDNLRVNAASLVYGGINDIYFDWKRPHLLHRVGNDVDIDGYDDNPNVWKRVMAAATRGGGFKRCEVHNADHVHCYHAF